MLSIALVAQILEHGAIDTQGMHELKKKMHELNANA